MSIVGGLDIHRSQITFDYLDTRTGEVRCGQVRPADREHLRAWLARFAGQDGDFAMEGCTGWRYVAEEVAAAGLRPHVADPAELAALRGRRRHAKTDRADARFAGRDDVAFALEGCTGWRYVAEELAAAGVTAHLAEPADTAFARGRKRHAKTDKTDSRHLRMLLAQGRRPEWRSRPPASWKAGPCSSCITTCGPNSTAGMRCTQAVRSARRS